MSCELLNEMFAAAAKAADPTLYVTFSSHVFDAKRGGGSTNSGVIQGSGPLRYTPGSIHFVEPAFFSGVVPCTVTWHTQNGIEAPVAENITMRVGASLPQVDVIRISLSTEAGSSIPENFSFEPGNCYRTSVNTVSVLGVPLPDAPTMLLLTLV